MITAQLGTAQLGIAQLGAFELLNSGSSSPAVISRVDVLTLAYLPLPNFLQMMGLWPWPEKE